MTEWVPITYRDFWDVPRIFFTTHRGQLYLFDCPFDETGEDYPDTYQVFEMPPLTDADYAGSWTDLWRRSVRKVGEVPVSAARFDRHSRPRYVATDIFDLLPPAAPANGVHAHPAAPTGTTGPVG